MAGLLRMRSFWVIIAFVLCTWTFYTVFDQQMFPKYYIGLFSSEATGNSVYGVLNSIQVFLEAAMMGVVPIVMRKVGVKATLMMGVTVMCLRIGLCGVFHDPIGVSVVKMFHSLEVPLFVLGIFRYITLHFNTAMSATLYLVGFQISAQVGNVILSPPLGQLRDQLGFRPVFFIISGIVAIGGVFAYFALKKDDLDVQGEPLVADTTATADLTAKH
jgi:OHS family lactose permease-like MFS transporter